MHTAKANSITIETPPLTGGTEAVYFFHSDHLGSASWITNNTGLPVQHLLYLPFGEHFVNERNTAYDERFTFTGKERDAETGYYYHGARFNSSDLGWLSVDPMAEKYPSISPYAYCAWNPVKLVDEDGEEVEYSSFYDRLLVFLERTFNKGFRMRFDDLKKSTEIYVFNNNDEAINKLSTDGKKIFINYSLDSKSKEDGSTVFSLLRHETEHAVQFEYGEVGFAKNSKGEWKPMNVDINDELKARDFESGWFNINARALHARWGTEGYNLSTREEKIAELRRIGYTYEDKIWNNRDCDVGKNESVFALKYRKRSY